MQNERRESELSVWVLAPALMNDTYTEKIRSLQLPASVIDRLNASGEIMNVMGPVHPKRTAFCNALGGKGYCNFVKGHRNFVVGAEGWDASMITAIRELYWRADGQRLTWRQRSNCFGSMADSVIAKSCSVSRTLGQR